MIRHGTRGHPSACVHRENGRVQPRHRISQAGCGCARFGPRLRNEGGSRERPQAGSRTASDREELEAKNCSSAGGGGTWVRRRPPSRGILRQLPALRRRVATAHAVPCTRAAARCSGALFSMCPPDKRTRSVDRKSCSRRAGFLRGGYGNPQELRSKYSWARVWVLSVGRNGLLRVATPPDAEPKAVTGTGTRAEFGLPSVCV